MGQGRSTEAIGQNKEASAETIEPSTEAIGQNKEASAETIEPSTEDEHKDEYKE